MARVTRSKNIDIVEDHTALTIQNTSPQVPSQHSDVLSEIHNSMVNTNLPIDDEAVASEVRGLKAAYKAALGLGKRGKKSKTKSKGKAQHQLEDTLADDSATNGANSPVPESNGLLLQDGKDHAAARQEQKTEQPAPPTRVTRRQLANAQAAEEALAKQQAAMEAVLNQNMAQDEVAPETDQPIDVQTSAEKYSISDFPQSPVRTLAEVEREYGAESPAAAAVGGDEDSFVREITCRSPAKPVSRIEDSVEALDQLEDALDALDQAALAEQLVSPEKKRQSRPQENKPMATKQPQEKVQPAKFSASTMRVKSTAPRLSVIKKATSMNFKPVSSDLSRSTSVMAKTQLKTKAPLKRPLSLMPPKETVRSTKPPTRATFELPGEAVARKLKEQKEARLAQRGSSEDTFYTARTVSGPKIKSTKPPTVPAFELPGEALSRKKREAHEARLKAQEEEDRKRREFKAKPVRTSVAPDFVPRATVASLARQSKIGLENMGIEDGTKSKRGSNVGAHRPSIFELNKANISAPRAKAALPPRKPSPTTHGPSMSGRAMQRTVTSEDVQVQRQRAREIYNRDAKILEDMEREKKEREAAAKRAREEAAERGRQASREWAEKQLARKAVSGDQGLSAGYGPGGQLGLKG